MLIFQEVSSIHRALQRFDSAQERNDEVGLDVGCSQHPSWAPHSILRSFPDLIEDLGRQRGRVLRQEATIVLSHDIRSILNSITRLLV